MKALRYRSLDAPGSVCLAARLKRRLSGLEDAQASLARSLVGESDALPPLTRAEFAEWTPAVEALSSGAEPAFSATHALSVCLRNEFRLLDDRGAPSGAALYPATARANHSCAPNIRAYGLDGWVLRVEALRDIAAGEELLNSYVSVSDGPAPERAAWLRSRWLFDCACGAPNCASMPAC